MKSINQSSKGITLIALIITVIILLILASVATYSGISVIRHSKLVAFTTELKIMQTQVNELYEKWRNEEKVNGKNVLELGQEILDSNTQAKTALSGAELTDQTGYRYYNQETIKELNIEGVESEFLINIESRSVVSYEGMKYDGKIYYTLEQLPDGLYNVNYKANGGAPTFELASKEIANGQWKITVSNVEYSGNINKWQVEYRLEGEEYWQKSSSYTFEVKEEGTYEVRLVNNGIIGEEKIKIAKLYYFDARIENARLEAKNLNNTLTATTKLYIENYDSIDKYNKFDTNYEVYILDGNEFSMNNLNVSIEGGSAKTEEVDVILTANGITGLEKLSMLTLVVKMTEPYEKEIHLPIAIYPTNYIGLGGFHGILESECKGYSTNWGTYYELYVGSKEDEGKLVYDEDGGLVLSGIVTKTNTKKNSVPILREIDTTTFKDQYSLYVTLKTDNMNQAGLTTGSETEPRT